MTAYYLIPTLWSPEKPNCTVGSHDHWDWIRLVECSHQRKESKAQEYELELNNGEVFDMEKVVIDKKELYSVLPIPYNQARDYVSFSQWPCNIEGDTEYSKT